MIWPAPGTSRQTKTARSARSRTVIAPPRDGSRPAKKAATRGAVRRGSRAGRVRRPGPAGRRSGCRPRGRRRDAARGRRTGRRTAAPRRRTPPATARRALRRARGRARRAGRSRRRRGGRSAAAAPSRSKGFRRADEVAPVHQDGHVRRVVVRGASCPAEAVRPAGPRLGEVPVEGQRVPRARGDACRSRGAVRAGRGGRRPASERRGRREPRARTRCGILGLAVRIARPSSAC